MSRSKHTIAANGHVGRPYADHGAMAFPIFQSSNFKYEDAAPYVATLNGGPETKRFKYSRYTNPTEAEALRILCELEGADGGVLVGSGMAAVSLVYSTFLRPGDHVVISENSYYRSYSVLKRSFERIGVSVSVLTAGADLTDLLTERTTLVHVETPSNYLLRVFDIARIAARCRAHGALLSIDSTLATPINQNPLAHGADLVVHSASKYLGGHNDIVAGVIVGRQELVDRLAQEKGYSGASVDPFASYLLLRGLKTLAVRMAHVNASTLRIAQELRELDGIEWVCHPGLPEHPDHELAGRYLGGGAGILYASLAPGRGSNDQTVVDFLDGLEVCVIASSFGGTESLARPANMEEFPDHPRLIRFAIGLESAEDIVNDVKQSLKRLHA